MNLPTLQPGYIFHVAFGSRHTEEVDKQVGGHYTDLVYFLAGQAIWLVKYSLRRSLQSKAGSPKKIGLLAQLSSSCWRTQVGAEWRGRSRHLLGYRFSAPLSSFCLRGL